MSVDLKITPVLQGRNSNYCVPYTALTILNHYLTNPPSIKSLIVDTKASRKGGAFVDNFKDTLNFYGFKIRRLAFAKILYALKRGNPVVIGYKYGVNESHLSLISGYFKDKGITYFILSDSWYGKITLPKKILEVVVRADGSYIREILT